MKKFLSFIIVSLFLILPVQAQDTLSFGTAVTSLSASSGGAATNGTAYALPGNPAAVITWTASYSATPDAVTVLLQASLDNSTYFTLDTSTSVAGELRSVTTSARFIRARITVKTGTFNTTVGLVAKSTVIIVQQAPAGNTTEVQYNNAGVNGASPDFKIDLAGGNATLLLSNTVNGTALIQGNAVGTQVQILAGNGDASHTGGEIAIGSGSSAGGDGGDIDIIAGGDSADANGGSITIRTGSGVDGESGELALRTGASANWDSGDIFIQTGGFGHTQGSVQVGGKTISLFSNGVASIEINPTGTFISGGVLNVTDLPILDPLVLGQIWNSSGTLKISAGPPGPAPNQPLFSFRIPNKNQKH